jgi:cellulose synthase (UDP-forming)
MRGDTSLGAAARPRAVAAGALLVGALYLLWRSTTLGTGWFLILSGAVLVIEVWSWLELAFLTVQAWTIPPSPPRGEIDTRQDPIDVVIDAHRAEPDELERTLIAARVVRSRGRLVVVDSERRFRHRKLATDAGATYRIDPRLGTAPGLAVHRATTGDRYVWLTAGQVPTPDLVEVIGPRFDDDGLAVCQLATSLLNAEDLAHLGRERDDTTLLNQIIGPALSRWGAAPWLGPASVVRRRAVDDAGGFAEAASIERLAARLHRAGWTTSFERRRLVASTEPESMEHYLAERRRRAAATLRVVLSRDGPLLAPALRPGQRLAHLGAAFRFGGGIRLLLLAIVVAIVLVTGRFPTEASVWSLASLWAAVGLAGALARRSLARGSMRLGDQLHQGWRVLGAEVAALFDVVTGHHPDPTVERPARASSGLRALAELPLLDAVVLLLDLALLARAATLVDGDLLPPFPTAQRVVVLGFALALLVPVVHVLQVAVLRQQRRAHYRIPAVLDATIDGSPATTVDVTPSGAGVLLPVAPSVGSVAMLEISLPGTDGVTRRIVGRAAVRSVRPEGPGQWRVGLELTQVAGPARQALLAFCAQAPDDGQDEPAVEVADPVVVAARRRRRSVRRATVTAGLAGLATMIFGPGVAAAETATPELVDEVCVAAPDGSSVPGVAVERRLGATAQVLGVTDASGCLAVLAVPATDGFVLRYRGNRYEAQPVDYAGTDLRVPLVESDVRVVDLSGQPVPGAQVRFFTDRWVAGVPVDGRADTTRFVGLPATPDDPPSIEVRLGGARFVREVMDPTALHTVVLARVRIAAGEPLGAFLDRGTGWEPAIDGMDLVPGPLVVRLDDGTVLRLDVPESHRLLLPEGELVPVVVDLPRAASTPTSATTPTSAATSTSTPTSTSTSTSAPTSTPASLATSTTAPAPDGAAGAGSTAGPGGGGP